MNGMKNICVFLVIFLTTFIFGVGSVSSAIKPFEAKVVYVVDGDSIIVKKGKRKTKIRLWGVDSPEKAQQFSRDAGRFTKELLLGKKVKIVPVQWDDYGRLVAMVLLGRKNISEELVRSGYAWVHIYYCRKKICRSWESLEREAREARIGLWGGDKIVEPWVWKRNKKKRRKKNHWQ